jgi:hypothetical protein
MVGGGDLHETLTRQPIDEEKKKSAKYRILLPLEGCAALTKGFRQPKIRTTPLTSRPQMGSSRDTNRTDFLQHDAREFGVATLAQSMRRENNLGSLGSIKEPFHPLTVHCGRLDCQVSKPEYNFGGLLLGDPTTAQAGIGRATMNATTDWAHF